MATIPEPRPHNEHHAPKCLRHHHWMAGCPDCGEWNRERLRAEREAAAKRHEAAR